MALIQKHHLNHPTKYNSVSRLTSLLSESFGVIYMLHEGCHISFMKDNFVPRQSRPKTTRNFVVVSKNLSWRLQDKSSVLLQGICCQLLRRIYCKRQNPTRREWYRESWESPRYSLSWITDLTSTNGSHLWVNRRNDDKPNAVQSTYHTSRDRCVVLQAFMTRQQSVRTPRVFMQASLLASLFTLTAHIRHITRDSVQCIIFRIARLIY